MRWLWLPLVLAPFSMACNSSSGAPDGTACASAGGTCIFASCTAYCLNGSCWTPLEGGAQDCPSSLTNSAGETNTGNPCCVNAPEGVESGAPEASTPDASIDGGQTIDATVAGDADASVGADATIPTDGSGDGANPTDGSGDGANPTDGSGDGANGVVDASSDG
jgi:hypothetical protein